MMLTLEYDLDELETEFFKAIKELKELTFIDSEEYLYQAQKARQKILAEGAQGSLLDIDFGTYPLCNLFKYNGCRSLHWIRNCTK